MINIGNYYSPKSRWQWLRQFWCDPRASHDVSERYLARQVDAFARQLPLVFLAKAIVFIVCFCLPDNILSSSLFQLWSVCLLGLAICDSVAWFSLSYRRFRVFSTNISALLLFIMIGCTACLYTSIAVNLMGSLYYSERLILVGFIAAFIATGAWQFAVLPSIGVFWVSVLSIGTALGVLINYGSEYLVFSTLLVVYWLYLSIAVLITSRRFVAHMIAETAIESQGQVVSLLLEDFENNASDWLWEIDEKGNLQHVSPRLSAVLGKSIESLLGQSFHGIFQELLPKNNSEAEAALRILNRNLHAREPFSSVHIATQVGQEVKWWSLKAQPLLSDDGGGAGWRGVGSDITVPRLREKEMINLANVDSLTGLANRYCFGNRLESCFIHGDEGAAQASVIALDVDNFKIVNDLLGHLAGDQLLKEVATRLALITPKDILLARLGGDEFAWVFAKGLSTKKAESFAVKVRQVLAEPWFYQEHSFDITASMGVASAPMDGNSPTSLLRASDMALYAAKARGKNTLSFFDTKLDEEEIRRLSLLNDLRKSVSRDEFIVLYQPQIRFGDGALVGFEALVRWRHPVRGLVSPLEFIPLAEENGLIVPIGKWVMRQACLDAMSWPDALSIAVNISSVQIERSNLISTVSSTLEESGLPPHRLELELTESSLMNDGDRAVEFLTGLRELGVRVALDDFGTGYSSLSYLQKLPIDKLKIDRSFVLAASEGEQDYTRDARSILCAILELANALGLKTIAEGVETLDMADMLTGIGVEDAQGFFYGKPMSAERASQFIEEWPTILKVQDR